MSNEQIELENIDFGAIQSRRINDTSNIDLDVAIIKRCTNLTLTLENYQLMSVQHKQAVISAILEAKIIKSLYLKGQMPNCTDELSDLFRRARLETVWLSWPYLYPSAVSILLAVASNTAIRHFTLHLTSHLNMLTTEQWNAIENSFKSNSTIECYEFIESHRFPKEWWQLFCRVIEHSTAVTSILLNAHGNVDQIIQSLRANRYVTKLRYHAMSAASCQILVERGIPLSLTNRCGFDLASFPETLLLRHNLLTEFSAKGDSFDKDKLAEFFDALQYNKSLKDLDLYFYTGIPSTNIHLARALRTNTSLTKLNINVDYTDVPDESTYTVFDAIAQNTSLTSVSLHLQFREYNYNGPDRSYNRYKAHLKKVIKKNRSITSLHVHPSLFSRPLTEDITEFLTPILAKNLTLLEFSCKGTSSTQSDFPELMQRNYQIAHRVKTVILLHNILRHESLFGPFLPRELWLMIFELSWPGPSPTRSYSAVIRTIFDVFF